MEVRRCEVIHSLAYFDGQMADSFGPVFNRHRFWLRFRRQKALDVIVYAPVVFTTRKLLLWLPASATLGAQSEPFSMDIELDNDSRAIKFGDDRAIPAGIKPSASDMRSHEQAPEPEPDVSGQLMKQLGKELEERQKARETQQAEDARQARAQAEVRLKQNICLSDNITSEWRTPPASGKMAKLKGMLITSFRERAETASYNQTKWFLIDSHNYPTWDMVSFPYSIVSGIPGGSCPSGTHHEFLPLTP